MKPKFNYLCQSFVIEDGKNVCKYSDTVTRKEEIRHVLEIGDDETITFKKGVFYYPVSENKYYLVTKSKA